MTSQSLAHLSQKLTSTSSLLLERSRVISLNLPPSASSQNQIIRNLTTSKDELESLEIEVNGLSLGGGSLGKGKKGVGVDNEMIKELGERYDRLIEVFGEDEIGREKGRELRREFKRPPTPPTNLEPTTPTIPSSSSPIPKFRLEPPTPANEGPFKDYPDDYDPESNTDGRSMTPHDLLTEQQLLIDDQDERLNLLSHSIGRQNHLSLQIGTELDHHHELLEETDQAMDRTSERLRKARGRLDKVAHDARTYGSTITIIILIFILLILIIVFKT